MSLGENEEWVGEDNNVPGHLPLRRKGKDKMPIDVSKRGTVGSLAQNHIRDYRE